MKNYPMEINGWEYILDPYGMSYWKERDTHYDVICLMWIDTVKGDDGYNSQADAWCGVIADGNTLDDALEMLDIMPFEITNVMRREEAEKELINYMETH